MELPCLWFEASNSLCGFCSLTIFLSVQLLIFLQLWHRSPRRFWTYLQYTPVPYISHILFFWGGGGVVFPFSFTWCLSQIKQTQTTMCESFWDVNVEYVFRMPFSGIDRMFCSCNSYVLMLKILPFVSVLLICLWTPLENGVTERIELWMCVHIFSALCSICLFALSWFLCSAFCHQNIRILMHFECITGSSFPSDSKQGASSVLKFGI